MSRRNTAIAVVAALLVAVVLYFVWPRGGGNQTAGSGAADEPGRRIGGAAALVPGQAEPARLGGIVVDGAGAPVAGATVSMARLAISRGERATPGAAAQPIVETTGADGRFSIEDIAPGSYSAAAAARGHLPGRVSPIVLAAGDDRDDLRIVIERGGHTLSGVVSDIGGGPVHGALVRTTAVSEGDVYEFFRAPATAVTDGDGRYALTLGDGAYLVEVFHLDYVGTQTFTQIRGTDRTENFELLPGGVVYGQVRSRATDEPIAGATVTYLAGGRSGGRRGPNFDISSLGLRSSISGADGRFVVRGLTTGVIELRAFGPGYASREPTEVALGIGEEASDIVVYVDRAFTIAGTVVDKKNPDQAIAGVLLGAFNFGGALHIARESSADDGSFAIHGVQNGTYFVGAAGQGRVVNVLGTNVTVDNADVEDVVVELDPGVTVRGRVEPGQNARVALEVDGESIGLGNVANAFAAATVRGRADADGNFELSGVPDGAFKLVARGDDGSTGALDIVIAGADQNDLVIAMESRSLLSGIVVNPAGEPLEGLYVSARKKGGGSRSFSLASFLDGRAVTGPDGQFEILGLEAGDYLVSVSDSRGDLAWSNVKGADAEEPRRITIEAAPRTGVRLEVEARSGTIRGVVVGPGGAPVADAWITARRSADGEPEAGESRRRRGRRGWSQAEKPVLSDSDGAFEIRNLRDASYDLSAEGLKGEATGEVTGIKAGATGVTVRLATLARVVGKVTSQGQPVTSYVISADGPTSRRKVVANPDGSYRLTRLEAGSYTLSVVAEDGNASGETKVEASGEATLNLELVTYGSVRGVVVDATTGEPMADLSVAAFSELGSDTESLAMSFLAGEGPRTGDKGQFRVGRLGAGKGTLIVFDGDAAGFEMIAQKEFELTPGQSLDLGELMGTSARRVPKEERGDVGMQVEAATWADRPGAGDEPGDPPAGTDGETELLWVLSVDEGGAAERAGVEVGDQVLAVNGIAVTSVGANLVEQSLSPRRIKAGEPLTITIDRAGRRDTLTVIPAPVDPE